MPAIAILIGLMLILTGLGGFGYGYAKDGVAHFTAMIPAIIGLLILLCGAVAIFTENLRKHLMHAALAIAGLGGIATAITIFTGKLEMSAPLASKSVTAVLCFVFVILGVRSFIAARRDRVDTA
jgi:hypothetical protein